MKKLSILFGLLFAVCLPLWSSSSLSPSEKEELTQIIDELDEIVTEQQTIIENSQTRNEELESLSKKQSERINELLTLSDSKQKTIDEQQKTISELENSLEKPGKSSLMTLINAIIAVFVSFCCGFLAGGLFI